MPKGLPVFLILLVCMFEAVAQERTADEFVITIAGDTLFGQVQQGISPQSISFKASAGTGTTSRKFTVEEIKAYKTENGRFYVPKTFTVSEPDENKTVFVQALVLGKVSLFKYKDLFLLNKDDSTQILIRKIEEEKRVNGRKVVRSFYSNIGAFNYLLSDCSSLPPNNRSKQVSERILTKLVVAYNECTAAGSYTEFGKEKAWTKINIGIGAGLSTSGIDFFAGTTSFPFFTEPVFTQSLSPALMASFTISSPRINERLFLQAEILYNSHRHSATYLNTHTQIPDRYEVSVDVKSFIFPFSFGYVLTDGRVRTNLSLGASLYWNLHPTIAYVKEAERENIIHTYIEEPLLLEKTHYGLWGGLEASTKLTDKIHGFLALRGGVTDNVFSGDISSKKLIEARITTISLLTGIKF